ncbi:MAG TPA: tripartite tricarboxylate transporter substrate-binding protein [Beijerinckiaceae bacterium]|nr:tripartite tricarboxylate transporter substrate-binding protein [Beijerinckiaceae bacterium]
MKYFAKLCKWLAPMAVALSLSTITSSAQAQDAEAAYYKGKTVRFIVGFGPGGGYDTYARMIAPYIAKALGATVVVENQPGAGGISALNNLVAAPKDGLQIMHLNGSAAALSQVLALQGVRYDLTKLGQLGTVSLSPFVWLDKAGSPIKTVQDAINAHKKLSWASAGAIDVLSAGAAFTCQGLKLDCSIVPGYAGSNEAALAISKGEMDAMYVSDVSANDYVKSGQTQAVTTIARKRSPFFPDTPTIFEAAQLGADQEFLFDYYAAMGDLSRIIVAPPDLPPARLAFLQAAVKKALTDADLVAQGQKTQFYVNYLDPNATSAAVAKVVGSLTPEQRDKVKAVLSTAVK